ncbi:MAPK kinase substrate protein At1g80180 [Mercurialis annua]|uniref:MAPK kinase substrate protein At1g80180 n=1 Tax=Mercurialis annua TaxID=3986 RepID=UPI002160F181|nr:MAPK kinase substrate protein At1g80180 [Mercurialis annua]
MEASGLARSTTSFRRQGSSGLVWDDKVITGEFNQNKEKAPENNGNLQRSRSAGGVMYRAMKVSSPPRVDPPSPKVSGCGLCGIFGKQVSGSNNNNNHRQRKSRKR